MKIYINKFSGYSGKADAIYKTLKEAKADDIGLISIVVHKVDGRKIDDLSFGFPYMSKNWHGITDYEYATYIPQESGSFKRY